MAKWLSHQQAQYFRFEPNQYSENVRNQLNKKGIVETPDFEIFENLPKHKKRIFWVSYGRMKKFNSLIESSGSSFSVFPRTVRINFNVIVGFTVSLNGTSTVFEIFNRNFAGLVRISRTRIIFFGSSLGILSLSEQMLPSNLRSCSLQKRV